MEIAAKARYTMVQHSSKHTPGFTYGEQHRITSYAETIKYMKTMVDSTGQTKREFVKILFREYFLLWLLPPPYEAMESRRSKTQSNPSNTDSMGK